jgi:hypothetical protein
MLDREMPCGTTLDNIAKAKLQTGHIGELVEVLPLIGVLGVARIELTVVPIDPQQRVTGSNALRPLDDGLRVNLDISVRQAATRLEG